MAAPRPFGRGPYGAGPYSRYRAVVYEVGGVSLLSFDASGAAALAWRRTPPGSVGAWPQQDCTPGVWEPVDACGTGSWTKQRLPELEPT